MKDIKDVELYMMIIFVIIMFPYRDKPTFKTSASKNRISIDNIKKQEKQDEMLEEILEEKIELESEKIFSDGFEKKQFYEWVKNIFIKYKQALEDNNLEIIKTFSTQSFLEVQDEIMLEKKNEKYNFYKITFDKINSVRMYKYFQNDEEDVLTLIIKYTEILDEFSRKSGKKIKGLSGRKINKTAYVDFKRNNRREDKEEINNEDGKNIYISCLNCGAPTHIITVGKCAYCGNVIKVDIGKWKLNKIEENKEIK